MNDNAVPTIGLLTILLTLLITPPTALLTPLTTPLTALPIPLKNPPIPYSLSLPPDCFQNSHHFLVLFG